MTIETGRAARAQAAGLAMVFKLIEAAS
jgi:hypothetical protein